MDRMPTNGPVRDEWEVQYEYVALPKPPTPYITYVIIGICGIIFSILGLADGTSYQNAILEAIVPNCVEVWNGAYWGLLVCAFVHVGLLHFSFNMFGAFYFGRVLEPTMGRVAYTILILLSAAVASGAQLAMSDQTGIGFSGVAFAMFGYTLAARDAVPLYRIAVHDGLVKWLLTWLFICIVLTLLGIMRIANSAHFAGFAFGYLMGNVLAAKRYIVPSIVGILALLALAVCSVTYLPWSATWQHRAEIADLFSIQEAAASGSAKDQFQYGAMLYGDGYKREAIPWLEKAADQGQVDALNLLAWMMATDPDGTIRNGDEAVRRAEQLCQGKDGNNPRYVDTLAAAYAEAGRWDKAIATQKKAIELLGNDEQNFLEKFEDRLMLFRKEEKYREE